MDNLDTFAAAAKNINFPNPIYRYTQVKNQLEGVFSLIPENFLGSQLYHRGVSFWFFLHIYYKVICFNLLI
jgi:hypothetical protein